MPAQSAFQVAETLLDVTGKALLTHDFDAFAPCFALPQRMTTFGRVVLIEDRAGLQASFDEMCRAFRGMGVTALVREVLAAEYRSDSEIATTHLSHVMRHGTRLKDPYPVMSILRLTAGRWQIGTGDYALDDNSAQGRALRAGSRSGVGA